MSNTFELWQKAEKQRNYRAYLIAKAVADGFPPRQTDIDQFKKSEAEMADLETRFSEDS